MLLQWTRVQRNTITGEYITIAIDFSRAKYAYWPESYKIA